ncbi:MAG: hypothetical protein AAB966_00280 [Patescibacteria group bacterium]
MDIHRETFPLLREIIEIEEGENEVIFTLTYPRFSPCLTALFYDFKSEWKANYVKFYASMKNLTSWLSQNKDKILLSIPRKLTPEEISSIVKSIPQFPGLDPQIADMTIKQLREVNSERLSNTKFSPICIPALKEWVKAAAMRARVDMGTTVGIHAAESVGQSITQETLNNFHTAGAGRNSGSKLMNVRELIYVTKRKNPSCTIHFKDRLTYEDTFDKRAQLTQITLENLKKDYQIGEIGTPRFEIQWYHEYYFAVVHGKEFPKSEVRFCLRLYLDRNMMYAHRITGRDIVKSIEDSGSSVYVCPIPFSVKSEFFVLDIFPKEQKIAEDNIFKRRITAINNHGSLFITFNILPLLHEIVIKGILGIIRIYPESKPVLEVVKENYEKLEGDRDYRIKLDKNRLQGYGKTVVDDLCEACDVKVLNNDVEDFRVRMPDLEKSLPNLLLPSVEYTIEPSGDYILSKAGEGEIKKAGYRIKRSLDEGKFLVDKTPMPTPFNLFSLLISNDRDSESKYEIEQRKKGNRFFMRPSTPISRAARYYYLSTEGINLRACLAVDGVDPYSTYSNDLKETKKNLGIGAAANYLLSELYIQVSGVDPRHLSTIVSVMTSRGDVFSINTYGISRQPGSALAQATLDRPIVKIQTASIFGSSESTNNTSVRVMTGGRPNLGTGIIDPSVDGEKMKKLIEELLAEGSITEYNIPESDLRLEDIKGVRIETTVQLLDDNNEEFTGLQSNINADMNQTIELNFEDKKIVPDDLPTIDVDFDKIVVPKLKKIQSYSSSAGNTVVEMSRNNVGLPEMEKFDGNLPNGLI